MTKKKSRAENLQNSIGSVSDITNQAQSELFHREILKIKKNGISLLEAISQYCEDRDLDPEDITAFLTPQLMADLTTEAADLKLLKREYRDSRLDM